MKRYSRYAIVSLSFLSAGNAYANEIEARSVATLNIEVKDIRDFERSSQSQICYAIFNSSKGFPRDATQAVRQGCVEVTSDVMQLSFENVPSLGNGFVVSLFQDMNMSGKLETKKFFGFDVPAEPFGFTNNPPIMNGEPTFDKCVVDGDSNEIYIISLKTI